jgi:hypothetical protein
MNKDDPDYQESKLIAEIEILITKLINDEPELATAKNLDYWQRNINDPRLIQSLNILSQIDPRLKHIFVGCYTNIVMNEVIDLALMYRMRKIRSLKILRKLLQTKDFQTTIRIYR